MIVFSWILFINYIKKWLKKINNERIKKSLKLNMIDNKTIHRGIKYLYL